MFAVGRRGFDSRWPCIIHLVCMPFFALGRFRVPNAVSGGTQALYLAYQNMYVIRTIIEKCVPKSRSVPSSHHGPFCSGGLNLVTASEHRRGFSSM